MNICIHIYIYIYIYSYVVPLDPRVPERGGSQRYRGTSLIRNRLLLGPYSRTMPRTIQWTQGGLQFLMSEVALQGVRGVGGGARSRHTCSLGTTHDVLLTARHTLNPTGVPRS